MTQGISRSRRDPFACLLGAFAAIIFETGVHQPPAFAAAACVQPPADLVSWWTGDGNADDVWNGINGTLENGVSFVAGEVGQAFSFNRASTHGRLAVHGVRFADRQRPPALRAGG